MLIDPIRGIYEESSTLHIDPRTLFSDFLNKPADLNLSPLKASQESRVPMNSITILH
jgi:hypothetical protein